MTDARLGRLYVPDSRDWEPPKLHALLGEAALPLPPSMLWTDTVVMDQGPFGVCVGNGWAGWGDSAPIQDTYTEKDARRIYYEATVIDGQPDDPDAPGGGQQGSTVRSGAKAMQARGRLSAYAFATSLSSIREWLAFHGPVVMGTDWTNDMMSPDPNGVVRPTGGVAGGHCYLAIGYSLSDDEFRFRNSWGHWGLSGDFFMRSADVLTLLKGIDTPGEACLAAESPLAPVPTPTDPDATFAAVLRPWVAARHSGTNRNVATAAKAWLAGKGLTARNLSNPDADNGSETHSEGELP